MKKVSLGAYVMIIVAAVAVILSVSLWYATPWKSWRGSKNPVKKVRMQQPPAGQQVPVTPPPVK
ncbi:hypothetical protein HGA34_05550 [Candidatus Falkowbacteria bacterium]|nr:hypothetical protein [Candidatus Falkowbacteria bacterium]